VRRSIVAVSLLLGVLFTVADMPAATRSSRYYRQPARNSGNGYEPVDEPRRPVRVTSRISRPQFLGDANSVTAKVKEFEGLAESVDKVGTAGRQESREWMRGSLEDRIRLAEVVQGQAVEELGLIRELAAKEGAKETVAAIDAIVLERYERYKAMVTRMEEQRRRMRYGERVRPDARSVRRGGRSRYGDEGRYWDRYGGRYGARGGYREQDRYYEDRRLYPERERYGENYRYGNRYRGRVPDEQLEDRERVDEQDSRTKQR